MPRGSRGPGDQDMMHLSAPEHHMAAMASALQSEVHHQKQDQVRLDPLVVPVLEGLHARRDIASRALRTDATSSWARIFSSISF